MAQHSDLLRFFSLLDICVKRRKIPFRFGLWSHWLELNCELSTINGKNQNDKWWSTRTTIPEKFSTYFVFILLIWTFFSRGTRTYTNLKMILFVVFVVVIFVVSSNWKRNSSVWVWVGCNINKNRLKCGAKRLIFKLSAPIDYIDSRYRVYYIIYADFGFIRLSRMPRAHTPHQSNTTQTDVWV